MEYARPAPLPSLPLRSVPFAVERPQFRCPPPLPGGVHHPVHLQLEEDLTLMRLMLGIIKHRPPQARILDQVCPARDVELCAIRLWLRKGLEGVAPVPPQILLLGRGGDSQHIQTTV